MHSNLVLILRPLIIAIALAAFIPAHAGAQGSTPPTNDTCSTAILLPALAQGLSYNSPVVEVSNAGTGGDPVVPIDCAVNVSRSVWYRFTPNATDLYTFSLGADTATTVLDTVMAIYTSSTGCGGTYTPVQCNDDPGPLSAGISTTLTANTTYYIIAWVGPVTDLTNTPLNIQLRVSRPRPPINDTCAGAEPIQPATYPYLTPPTDTTLATETDDPEATCLAFTGARSVWYQFSPPTTGIYIFSTGSDTQTTIDDTALEIFRSVGGCGNYASVACSDNGLGRATATATLTNGQTYYIVVWDNTFPSIPGEQSEYIPGETLLQLRVSQATAPTVQTLGASSIASTDATLSAAINPNGVRTFFWFEYGPSTAYTATSSVRLILNNLTSTTSSSVPVTGIFSNATIHYRIVATNSVGRVNGQDQTFFWSGARPTLVNASGMINPGNPNFRLSFPGNPRQLYLAEMSTNLITWSSLGAVAEISPGQFQFTQNAAAFLPSRFYRVRLP